MCGKKDLATIPEWINGGEGGKETRDDDDCEVLVLKKEIPEMMTRGEKIPTFANLLPRTTLVPIVLVASTDRRVRRQVCVGPTTTT